MKGVVYGVLLAGIASAAGLALNGPAYAGGKLNDLVAPHCGEQMYRLFCEVYGGDATLYPRKQEQLIRARLALELMMNFEATPMIREAAAEDLDEWSHKLIRSTDFDEQFIGRATWIAVREYRHLSLALDPGERPTVAWPRLHPQAVTSPNSGGYDVLVKPLTGTVTIAPLPPLTARPLTQPPGRPSGDAFAGPARPTFPPEETTGIAKAP